MTNPTPEALAEPTEAIRQLREHQRQLDMDGVIVGVSRQAIDEVLAYVEALRSRPEPRQPDDGLVPVAQRNLRTFIKSALFKSTADQKASLDCLDVLEKHISSLDDLVAVLRSAVAASETVAARPTSEPLPDAVERTIIQADRDAAKALLDLQKLHEYEHGTFRSWDATVRAFRRHRLSAMPASSGEVGQVVAWLRTYDKDASIVRELAQNIADAIERGEHRGTPADHGWRDIASAPKDGTDILAVVAGNHPQSGQPFLPETVAWDGRNEAWWNCMWGWDNAHSEYQPTHWQPLPAPPHRGTDGSAEG